MRRPTLFLSLLAASTAASGGDASAQISRNVDLLSRVAFSGRLSDVWGYVQPGTGKEYALVGTFNGVQVVDCTDPRNPVVRGLIPTDRPGSSGNRWQDIKTFGSYAYAVSEAYGGVQIIDLRDPDRPRKVTTWGASLWRGTHNIAMDRERGIAYACGTSTGTHVLDVATDPTNPTRLTVLRRPYVHDLAVHNGLAHVAAINENRYYVYDVSRPSAMTLLNAVVSAGRRSCHSMWPSRDDRVLAVCHETTGGELVLYDISNPRAPRSLAKYVTSNASAIVHNPMVVDRVCHVAWNPEGYQALDISDPANPVSIGFYDTYTGTGTGFIGMWGVYAVQPSGVVYGSDRTGGLFVMKPKFTAVHYGRAAGGDTSPELHASGAAWIGNPRFRIDVAGGTPSASGVLVIGAGRARLPFQGHELLVDPALPLVEISIRTDADGEARVRAPIPNDARLVGGKLRAQAFVSDARGPLGLASTRGFEIEVFRR